MYHPSMWHPIDMTTAFRSIHPTTSPEKTSLSGFNAAFSVNTLLNQSSPSVTTTAAAHQHHLLSSLFQHYPYAAAFRPLFNGTSDSSAFLPANKKFKTNSHDENHCETTSSSDESFGKNSGMNIDCIQTLLSIKE